MAHVVDPALFGNNGAFLTYMEGRSGVYVVSPSPPVMDGEYALVKIGKAEYSEDWDEAKGRMLRYKGLRSRIDSYLLYWPQGVRVYGVIITTRDRTGDLEDSLHSYLASKGKQATAFSHNHREEYFWLKPERIQELVNGFAAYKGAAAVFSPAPHYEIKETQLATVRHRVQMADNVTTGSIDDFFRVQRQVEPPSVMRRKTPLRRATAATKARALQM